MHQNESFPDWQAFELKRGFDEVQLFPIFLLFVLRYNFWTLLGTYFDALEKIKNSLRIVGNYEHRTIYKLPFGVRS